MAYNIAANLNPPNIAQNFLAGQQTARANQQQDMQNALMQRQVGIQDQQLQQQQTVQKAKEKAMLAQAVLQAPPGQAAAVLHSQMQNHPDYAQSMQAAQQSGIDVNDDATVRKLAYQAVSTFGPVAGIEPPQPKYMAAGEHGVLAIQPGGQAAMVPGSAKPEEEKFGAPIDAMYQGKPAKIQVGSNGTIRPVGGASPYQAPSQAETKPVLVDVPQPDGTIQKQWVTPGSSSGTPVGAPTDKSGAGVGGGREATMFNRVLMNASQAAKTLENITNIKGGSSTGIFGGHRAGTSLMGSAFGSLANAMTTQEVQSYRPIIAGLTRSLGGIEAAGLMPNGALTHQMDAVVFQEGDTELTKLRKLAEARQIVEEGIKTYLDNPRVSDPQKAQINSLIGRIQKAIPFSQDDVTALENSNSPSTTINDIVKQRLSSVPAVAAGWKVTKVK